MPTYPTLVDLEDGGPLRASYLSIRVARAHGGPLRLMRKHALTTVANSLLTGYQPLQLTKSPSTAVRKLMITQFRTTPSPVRLPFEPFAVSDLCDCQHGNAYWDRAPATQSHTDTLGGGDLSLFLPAYRNWLLPQHGGLPHGRPARILPTPE